MQSRIQEARGSGYSDDEILTNIEKNDQNLSKKIQEARKSNYTSSEIVQSLSSGPEKPKTNLLGRKEEEQKSLLMEAFTR